MEEPWLPIMFLSNNFIGYSWIEGKILSKKQNKNKTMSDIAVCFGISKNESDLEVHSCISQ